MKPRTATLLTLAAGVSAPAAAQSFTTDSSITMTMSWREATSTGGTIPNPDGILEPGEHALILIDSVSFTNQGGTANFSPPIGTFTSGTIIGFGSGGMFDLNGSGGTVGAFICSTPAANSTGTSGFGVRGDWRTTGNQGPFATPDGLYSIIFGQYPGNPGGVNAANPIPRMLRILWTPASFEPRTARFDLAPNVISQTNPASVYLDFNGIAGASVYVTPANLTLGSVSIPIAPAPPTLALAAAAATLASRRRR
jgi:hypothetical protein